MRFFLFALFLILTSQVISQMGFTENIGQIKNQQNILAEDIYFTFYGQEVRVSLRKNGFSYELVQPTEETREKFAQLDTLQANFLPEYNFHRVDFTFDNSNFEIEKVNPVKSKFTINKNDEYFSPDIYEKIIYKNIQEGLDIEFLISSDNTFKYNIVSAKSHDLKDFSLSINGANDAFLRDGELVLTTDFGEIVENIPESFLQKGGELQPVAVDYILDNNNLSFDLKEDKKGQALIIDPEPIVDWSTYYGGPEGFEWGKNTAADSQGNVYFTGFTASLSGIATSGAYQGSFSGDTDGFLVKFDEDGNLQWGTYFGGPQTDRIEGLEVDGQDGIYVCGSTFSETGIATTGTFQPFLFGQDDAFVIKFDANGQKSWGTYIGGSAHDYATDVFHDGNDLYVAGHTTSNNNIATSGAFLEIANSFEHAFLIKISDDGESKEWGTYIGSDGNSSAEGLATLEDGRIVVCGRTGASSDIATPDGHQTVMPGFSGAFLMVFESNGDLDWGTYLGGIYTDSGSDVAVLNNEIYLVGRTNSENNIATSGAYQMTRSDEHGYLAKFDADGNKIWGTYVGGNFDDAINSVDARNGLIVLAGNTRSTQDIASPGAHQVNKSSSNSFDGFFKCFSPDGDYYFGSYIGGEDTEFIHSIKFHSDQKIIFVGQTSGSNGSIAFGNSHLPNYPAGGSETTFGGLLFVPCIAEISGGDDFEVCEEEELELNAASTVDVEWFEGSSLIGAGNSITIFPTANKTIHAVSTDYVNCKDTAVYEVIVEPLEDPSFDFSDFCYQASNSPGNIATPGGIFSFDPVPTSSVSINPSTGVISDANVGDELSVRYITPGDCPDTSYQVVTVLELDDPTFEYDDFCDGDEIEPTMVTTPGGVFYFAETPPGNANIDPNTGEVTDFDVPSSFEIGYETASGVCQNADTIIVGIFPIPDVSLGEDRELCVYNESIELSATPSGGIYNGNGIDGTTFSPADAGVGNHEIIYVYEENNCENSDTILIFVDECLSVSENNEKPAIVLYPNPSNGIVNIESGEQINRVVVKGINGQIILSESYNNDFVSFDLGSLSAGNYIISIQTNSSFKEYKLVLK